MKERCGNCKYLRLHGSMPLGFCTKKNDEMFALMEACRNFCKRRREEK